MSEAIPWLLPKSLEFPPLDSALTEPNGLLAVGGDLSSQRLISAYSKGIFPWFNQGEPILWWSPSPRALIPTDQLKINRTLKKFIKKNPFKITLNHAFNEVIGYCAAAPFRKEGTWIIDDMATAYKNLHKQKVAHSIEVWQENELVGGLYGVAINSFFSGESMFYRKNNASKIALIALSQLLRERNIRIIDCQISNPFLNSMGCLELTRNKFLVIQQSLVKQAVPASFWEPKEILLNNSN